MKNETAANRLEDNYYYKRGFDEGYKAGYQKALENVPEILATQSKSVIVIPKENIEEISESLQALAPGEVMAIKDKRNKVNSEDSDYDVIGPNDIAP